MTEYPALKIALRHWGDLAIPLLKEIRFGRYQIRDPRWQRDPDGVFREGGVLLTCGIMQGGIACSICLSGRLSLTYFMQMSDSAVR
jgi:hypothetical protein